MANSSASNSTEIPRMHLDFSRGHGQFPKEVTRDVIKLINHMINKIRVDPQVTLMALQPFLDYVYFEKGGIECKVDTVFRNSRKDIGNTKGKAMSESPDNHIVQAMVPVYEEARKIKGGPQAPQQRMLAFERGVTKHGSGVWMRAHDALWGQLEVMSQRLCGELKRTLLGLFIGIDEKFDLVCSDKEIDDPEEEKLRESLRKTLVVVEKKLVDDIQPAAKLCLSCVLAGCRRYFIADFPRRRK
ncbi:hypothetical protein LTR62_007698 [Meristemomyces frigidus]|uniref:Uncharacterized protein n=1 Tax=Meristemomyces frigidus TaxID=1508187 RepID=A0AAN7TBN1_9PEZI|nr:hypothetical protein LTR62_007698 [Meristemomyces frigidus]